jgi:signal transduction histidine kinase
MSSGPFQDLIEHCLVDFVSDMDKQTSGETALVALKVDGNLPFTTAFLTRATPSASHIELEAIEAIANQHHPTRDFGEDESLGHTLRQLVKEKSSRDGDVLPASYCYYRRLMLPASRTMKVPCSALVLSRLPASEMLPRALISLCEEAEFFTTMAYNRPSSSDAIFMSYAVRDLHYALESARSLTRAEQVLLWEYRPSENAYRSLSPPEGSYVVRLGGVQTGNRLEGIVGVARPEEPLVIYDSTDPTVWKPRASGSWGPYDPSFMANSGFKVCVAWPVVVDGELLGAYSIYSTSLSKLEYSGNTRNTLSRSAMEILRHHSDYTKLRAIEDGYDAEVARASMGSLATEFIHDYKRVIASVSATIAQLSLGSSGRAAGTQVQLDEARDDLLFLKELTDGFDRIAKGGDPAQHCEVLRVISDYSEFLSRVLDRENPKSHLELELPTRLAPDETTSAKFPEFALLRVLVNLLRNSAYWTKGARNKAVVLRLTPGRLGEDQAVPVALSVVDYGPGISSEDLGKVFEMGFTRRGHSGGSGIGLYAVSRLVRNAGGDVRVWSVPGVSTTFRLELPAKA